MIGDVLYNLFIMPWELIFEVIFWFFKDHPALAIFAISIVMNFLALPLYRRADAIQEAERDKAASMAEWVNHIKKTFKGDERYMMLTTYYRQQNYKPVYTLRSTFPLLLQVPFFMAAYHYLSHLKLLNGVSFLFLKDLGAPDQLLQIGSFTINIMPILMTLINVISAFIYLRGFPIRDKIQTYGIAVIFLVLLYNSPSGLVFYWTLNQIFSVLKNVFMKLVKSSRARNIFFSILGVVILIALIWAGFMNKPKKILVGVIVFLICQMPLILSLIKEHRKGVEKEVKPIGYRTFFLGSLFITILLGIVIPMSVIVSSPKEFITLATNPAILVLNNFCIYAGFFIIWLGIYYYMSHTLVRNIFTYAVWILSGVFVMDYMLFSKELGIMSSNLVFNEMPFYTGSEKLLNLLAVAVLAAALIVVMRFWKKAVQYIYIILILGAVILAGINIYNTMQKVQSMNTHDKVVSSGAKADDTSGKIIPLSKDGRNVIVFMLDRAISGYIPYIFNEKPELAKEFSGFTYYPNTISYANHTNLGSPSIFGGYEYTPAAMNARADERLADKHDEALLLMPTLFSEEGYTVTVCDPPYAGYTGTTSDLSIYNGLENTTARITFGAYAEDLMTMFTPSIRLTQKRNFFFYSLMRSVPTIVQNTVYNEGNYYSTTAEETLSCSDEFINTYSFLYNLSDLTEITEGDGGTLFMVDNETTHATTLLQTPEYEPVVSITSDPFADQERFTLNGVACEMDTELKLGHYHVNMAAYLQLARWFAYMKANGVYDNTRIIIVSDHGSDLWQFEALQVNPYVDGEAYNPVLMVKDFDAAGPWQTSDEFMTTGDVPYLAMNGVIDNMVNPFTGNEITNDVDKEEQMITTSHNWHVLDNDGYTFDTSDGEWYKIHGDIFDRTKWELVE